MVADGPMFLPGQMSRVYTWAGQHSVINCYVRAEPAALVNWFVKGMKLENNETFHIVNSGSNSSLEVVDYFNFFHLLYGTSVSSILNMNNFYAIFIYSFFLYCALAVCYLSYD